MVAIRFKRLKSGIYSIYLDIYVYERNTEKRRWCEFLNLRVSQNYSDKKKPIEAGDADTMELAQSLRQQHEAKIREQYPGSIAVKKRGGRRKYPFQEGEKVYFNLPGLGLSGRIIGFWTADEMIAKVESDVDGVSRHFYLPVTELRTNFRQTGS